MDYVGGIVCLSVFDRWHLASYKSVRSIHSSKECPRCHDYCSWPANYFSACGKNLDVIPKTYGHLLALNPALDKKPGCNCQGMKLFIHCWLPWQSGDGTPPGKVTSMLQKTEKMAFVSKSGRSSSTLLFLLERLLVSNSKEMLTIKQPFQLLLSWPGGHHCTSEARLQLYSCGNFGNQYSKHQKFGTQVLSSGDPEFRISGL